MNQQILIIWLCIMRFCLYRTTWTDLRSIVKKHSRAKIPLPPQQPELPNYQKKHANYVPN